MKRPTTKMMTFTVQRKYAAIQGAGNFPFEVDSTIIPSEESPAMGIAKVETRTFHERAGNWSALIAHVIEWETATIESMKQSRAAWLAAAAAQPEDLTYIVEVE